METEQFEQEVRDRQLQTWQKFMYVALGSAVTILFHVVDPLRDLIILFAFLFTTWCGFYLRWGQPWRTVPLTEARGKIIFGYLSASWLIAFAIFAYSLSVLLGLIWFAYTVFLFLTFWRTRQRLSAIEEMFP